MTDTPTPTDPYRQAQRELATWRSTHPRATLAEMEGAVEDQIAGLRARLLAEQTEAAFCEEHPLCRECGATMAPRARSTRTVILPRDKPLALERRYLVCPRCGVGLFPLDERLGLLPTCYSPFLVEAMVRLGARLPFAQVADEMARLFRVVVSPDTVRRLTEEAGAVQVGIEQRELERLEREAPPEPAGPALQQVSADGAMIPLVGGTWAEGRTLGIGEVEERKGEPHATRLTSFARLCSAEQFIRQA
ncbi:MAG: hypothetical protein JOZ41_12645, partial [Chloroflexi bacterium]|nr:hypothetical protein [Chloroflexota bacterium]